MSAEVDAIIARAEAGQATLRDGYYILEKLEQEAERLQEMLTALDEKETPDDRRVVIRVDNNQKLFRFADENAFADWLAKGFIKQ